MMSTFLYQWSLYLHVLSGFIALSAGLAAMIAQKGHAIHAIAGKWFFGTMGIVFWTSVLFFLLDPTSIKYHFFLGIAAISYYPVFTGRRVLDWKRGVQVTRLDWIRWGLLLVAGLGMAIYGIGDIIGWWAVQGYGVLFVVFSGVSFANVVGDWQIFTGRKPLRWVASHGGKMVGGYAAAVTAFCVNVVPRFLPSDSPSWVYLATWIAPGVLIGVLGGRIVKKNAGKGHVTKKSLRFRSGFFW